jgi:uncharacterized RDD family membrane protein YckC
MEEPFMTQNYSGFWIRFLAYLLDFVIELVLIGCAAFLIERQEGIHLLLGGLFLFALSWLYFAGMESSKYQATFGKMLIGMRVTDASGNRISFLRATARYFAKILSRISLGIGYFMVAFTTKKQGLHDIIASTVVVKDRHGRS